MPLVTCIIPAYNYAGWIAAAIDSVLAQPQADAIEIVVVDDGSTDATASVVAGYGDRVRYVHKPNGGLVSAVDRGIAEAGGRYLTLLDADDEWPPDRLTPLLAVVEARPEVGLVYGDMDVVDEHGARIHASFFDTYRVTPATGRAFPTLIKFNTVSGGAALWRASLRPVYHPIAAAAAYPDWWLAVTIARVAEIAYVPVVVNHYRQHGQNMGLAADEERSMHNTRHHDLPFRRWMLATAQPGEIAPPDLLQTLVQHERLRALCAGHFGLAEGDVDPVSDDDARRSVSAGERAQLALERGDHARAVVGLVNALAHDPWNRAARAELERIWHVGQAAAAPAGARRRIDGARGFATLAHAAELVEDPALLGAYAGAFSEEDDATLVVWAPGWSPEEAMSRLGPVVSDLGLAGDGGPDILVETGGPTEADGCGLAGAVDAVLSRAPATDDGLGGLPCFTPDAVTDLRALALAAGRGSA